MRLVAGEGRAAECAAPPSAASVHSCSRSGQQQRHADASHAQTCTRPRPPGRRLTPRRRSRRRCSRPRPPPPEARAAHESAPRTSPCASPTHRRCSRCYSSQSCPAPSGRGSCRTALPTHLPRPRALARARRPPQCPPLSTPGPARLARDLPRRSPRALAREHNSRSGRCGARCAAPGSLARHAIAAAAPSPRVLQVRVYRWCGLRARRAESTRACGRQRAARACCELAPRLLAARAASLPHAVAAGGFVPDTPCVIFGRTCCDFP